MTSFAMGSDNSESLHGVGLCVVVEICPQFESETTSSRRHFGKGYKICFVKLRCCWSARFLSQRLYLAQLSLPRMDNSVDYLFVFPVQLFSICQSICLAQLSSRGVGNSIGLKCILFPVSEGEELPFCHSFSRILFNNSSLPCLFSFLMRSHTLSFKYAGGFLTRPSRCAASPGTIVAISLSSALLFMVAVGLIFNPVALPLLIAPWFSELDGSNAGVGVIALWPVGSV